MDWVYRRPFDYRQRFLPSVLYPVAAGGNVTGSGSPQATTATASGAGVNTDLGSGTPQATTATASGAGVNTDLGSGTPQAVTATASGAGVNTDLGSGTPQATTATAAGVGITGRTGSGTPQATTATASGAGIGGALILVGIPVGFFSIANCIKDLNFRDEMYDEAQDASVWAFWLLGVDLPTDPLPKLSSNLELNIALIQNEAEGSATWARWAPGTQPENTGNLQLDMVAALQAGFVLT